MTNHYETLGVARDASPEKIKRAYRKLASAHHTDRDDGDHDLMVKINVAYGVLSDPERRERYDAGQDGGIDTDTEGDPITQQAVTRLLALFDSYLDKGDPMTDCIRTIQRGLELTIKQTQTKIQELRKTIGLYESKRRLVKRKNPGLDFYAEVIAKNTKALNETIAEAENYILVCKRVLDLTTEYEGHPDKPPPPGRGPTGTTLDELLKIMPPGRRNYRGY